MLGLDVDGGQDTVVTHARQQPQPADARAGTDLDDSFAAKSPNSDEIILLDEAMKELAAMDARKAQVVELKYFGGLTTEEIAEVLKVSPETVKRDWRFSRTWLLRELTGNSV